MQTAKKIERELHEHGIETDDDAELVLSKANGFAEQLIVRDKTTNARVIVPSTDIVFLESYGHLIHVHTKDGIFHANDRLYKLFEQLDQTEFLRISNSVVVAKVRRLPCGRHTNLLLCF